MKLEVEIEDSLYNKFYQDVTNPGGIWRKRDYRKETGRRQLYLPVNDNYFCRCTSFSFCTAEAVR